jgi:hypothetical protein
MFNSAVNISAFVAGLLRGRRRPFSQITRLGCASQIEQPMSVNLDTMYLRRHEPARVADAARLVNLVASLLIAIAPLLAFTTTAARACACGCSVFDAGFGGLPQEDDHGGRIFLEWWHSDQNTLRAGTSNISHDANVDKHITTSWYSIGAQYMFNRDWGFMARLPYANRDFDTVDQDSGILNHFNVRDFGDLELMGMYTGLSKDLSTGLIFGVKLPTGNYTAHGFDRDTALGTGSTDLILGGFHRGLITGDNAWQYFTQVRGLFPFMYRSSINPDTGTSQLYKPGYQIDGSAGIVYNNGYNILGFDKIAPLVQIIGSHRVRDGGEFSDPLNSGFDRLMIAPGIEFTKVLDEANKRVAKFYFDVEIPFYYRVNAGLTDDGAVLGQLIAPIMFKAIASYNF